MEKVLGEGEVGFGDPAAGLFAVGCDLFVVVVVAVCEWGDGEGGCLFQQGDAVGWGGAAGSVEQVT